MRPHSNFNLESVIELFDGGIIKSPLNIRTDLGEGQVDAILTADGKVTLGKNQYSDLQQAMDATIREQGSTSDVWQFWTCFSVERQVWTPLEHLRANHIYRNSQSEIRTSDTHPLRIDSVTAPGGKGCIGLTFCPGKKSEGLYGGTWDRDLDKDLDAIQSWGSNTLITLMETHEFEMLGVSRFSDTLKNSVINWHHLPIQDMQIPNGLFEKQWADIGPLLQNQLVEGQSIVIHCRGGLGRTGLLAARMLVEAGMAPVSAIAKVRSARVHSIETYKQEHYVLTRGWEPTCGD